MFRRNIVPIAGLIAGAVAFGPAAYNFFTSDSARQHRALNRFWQGKPFDDKVKIIFVLGGPGSGKGTVCARLVNEYGLNHISAGDELRAARDAGTEMSTLINNYILDGKIVPVEITCALLKNAIDRTPVNPVDMTDGNRVFLIDGFPRNAENIEGWQAAFADAYKSEKMQDVCVLHLVADQETMVQRCLGRAAEQARNDDNISSIRKRLQTYEESTKPVLERFRKDGKVYDINANLSADMVFMKICHILRCETVQVRMRKVDHENAMTKRFPDHVPTYVRAFRAYRHIYGEMKM